MRQPATDERDRDGRQEHGASDVGADEDRPPSHPVDPHAGRQREEDPRQEADDAEDADLERPGAEGDDGEKREREAA